MIRTVFSISFVLLLFVLVLPACGSDDGTGYMNLTDACLLFCETKAVCDTDGELPQTYQSDCEASCKAGVIQDESLGLSRNLINCAGYATCTDCTSADYCPDFTTCIESGGPLDGWTGSTDDQFGGLDGGQY